MDKVTAAAAPAPTQAAANLAPDLTGRTLGEFHLLRKLGQGGMGHVYLAEQLSLKRKVALKILSADVADNPSALQRFKVEAEAVARATHANIVQVYVIGEAEGQHYMALEYVEGRNLREFLAKKGPPELLVALSIIRQVAAALQRAGELGIIHRDIKPENILLTRKGEVKVADFGLSRSLTGDQVPLNITQSGVVMGTPLYMSPEQVEGKAVDARTDIYSLGITCYHMMAGHPPFAGNGAFEVALKHVREEPVPLKSIRPDLPEFFCAVVHKMMAKQPDSRYQTCRELLRDIAQVRESLSGSSGALPRPDISVELVAADAGTLREETRAVLPQSGAVGATTGLVALRRPAWRWVVAGLSVFFALGGGLLVAGWQHARGTVGSEPQGHGAAPADAQEVDAICYSQSPQKREKVLRDAVEEYLNPASVSKNPVVGLGLCLDLAVFYFEQDRLDEAEKFFTRLDGVAVRPYPTLSRFGRAIVLALRSQATESNKVFQDVYTNTPLKDLPLRPGGAAKPAKQEVEFAIWQNPPFRFWVAQALYYNEKNGLSRKDMPEQLQRFRESLPRL